jgi:hypothetical protein
LVEFGVKGTKRPEEEELLILLTDELEKLAGIIPDEEELTKGLGVETNKGEVGIGVGTCVTVSGRYVNH